MLKITIPAMELYDDVRNEFVTTKEQELQLEHSLVSLSKWEAKWHKPFLSNSVKKTEEEMIDYIKCMTLTQNVKPEVYHYLTADIFNKVSEYIENPMTATTIHGQEHKPTREVVTSELVYYWMITLGIPMECQKWHLNRLFMLINVCSVKNAPNKKMSRNDILAQNRALNAARRKHY